MGSRSGRRKGGHSGLYDNSDTSDTLPRLIGRKHPGVIIIDSHALPQVVAAVETIKTQ